MKKILVPTDFSDCADAAFHTALFLAEKFKAEIHLLHIINTPFEWVKVPKNMEKNHPDILKKIGEAKAGMSERIREAKNRKIKATDFTAFNKSDAGIVEHSSQYKNDFIVMGTFGEKGIKKLIGSYTKSVLNSSQIPVLCVKSSFNAEKLKYLTYASPFENPDPDFVKMAAEFSRKLNLKIDLLLVNTPLHFEDTKNSLKKMKAFEHDFSMENTTRNIYNAFSISEGVLRFNNTPRNLIFIEHYQRYGIEKLFNPSVTESVVNKSASAVLVFPQ